jgi:hypothetical protein
VHAIAAVSALMRLVIAALGDVCTARHGPGPALSWTRRYFSRDLGFMALEGAS